MKKFDIIIWGATSFTGKLVAEYIFKKYGSSKIKWAIAGRNLKKLEKIRYQVADENIPIFIADSFDEESLSKFVKKNKSCLLNSRTLLFIWYKTCEAMCR